MPSIAELHKLLQQSPDDPFLHYAIAMEHAKGRQVALACAAFDRCLTADPEYCYAYYHKAKMLASSGDPVLAIDVLRAGLLAAKRSGDAHAASEMTDLLDSLT